MLERHSALADATPYRSDRLQMGEVRGFSLTQAAGLAKGFEKALVPFTGKLPADVGVAVASKGRIIMRVGPAQFWFVGPETDGLAAKLAALCAVTPLSHSRTRIFLEGAPARDVLAKGMALDFHQSVFTPGRFAMTGLHHTPVLVHCVSENRFELYAMRTFALSVWDWLLDAALEFASPSR
ncbi:MAG: sarcosine oxidase subunit gamma [Aestuariivirga sp.]